MGVGESGDPMYTLEGSKQHAVAFNVRGREDGAQPEADPQGLANIRSASRGSSRSYVAFSSKDHGADAGSLAPTLRAMPHDTTHANGGGQVAIAQQWAVRRLTPRECERLQGLEDDYTLIPWRGGWMADGPRYRMIGNGMCLPVIRWVLDRVQQVHAMAENGCAPERPGARGTDVVDGGNSEHPADRGSDILRPGNRSVRETRSPVSHEREGRPCDDFQSQHNTVRTAPAIPVHFSPGGER